MTTPIIRRTTDHTPTQRIGQTDVSLESRASRVRLPFGGLVWNRPAAVIVRQDDGAEQRLPIRDVTRRRLIAILAIGLICLLAAPRPGRGP